MTKKTKNKIPNASAKFIRLNEFVKDPVFTVKANYDTVLYGEDNDLPYVLNNYYKNVGLHRALVDKKKNMFLGAGVDFDYTDDRTAKKTLEFFNSINPFYNMDELWEAISLDAFMYKGTYLQIIWEKGGKKIKEIYHMPYEQIRSGKKNHYGQVEKFYYNTSEEDMYKWKKSTSMGTNKYIVEFDAFSTSANKTKPQIMYIKSYEPGNNYYSLPDYIGALKDLDTMAAISDFHNANIHNNMQPGFLIYFTGPEPSETAQDAIVKQIKAKYSDTKNAGRPMVFFLDEGLELKVEAADSSGNADMYKLLSEDVKENIVTAHQIPRAVSGLMTPGSLGSTKELIEGVEIVRKTYIQPIQELFLSKFNKIMDINGLNDIELTSPAPNLMKYTLAELKGVFTSTEIREYLGKDPILEEEKKEDVDEEVQEEQIIEEKS